MSVCLKVIEDSSHRGSGIYYKDANGEIQTYNSDGVGCLLSIPHALIKDSIPTLPDPGDYGVLSINIHEENMADQEAILKRLIRKIEAEENVKVLGVRPVATNPSVIQHNSQYAVNLFQIIIAPSDTTSATKTEFANTVKRIGLNREDDKRMDVFSASTQFVVYKGMLSAKAFGAYFTDFQDPRFMTKIVASHNRFSTTSKTESRAAHPWYLMVHNGEINSAKSFRDYLEDHAADIEEKCGIVVDTANKGDSGMLGYYFEVMQLYIQQLYPELNLSLKDLFFITLHPAGVTSKLLTLAKDVLELPIVEGPANLALFDEEGCLISGKDSLGLRPNYHVPHGVSSEAAHNIEGTWPSKTNEITLFNLDGSESIYKVPDALEAIAGRMLVESMV